MSSRPLSVSVAAILLALFSLMNFPGPWWYLVPEAAEVTPMFVIYSALCWALWASLLLSCYGC